MQKPFTRENFPAKVGPLSFLGLALMSQTGMSFVQQGLMVLGVFFAAAYHLNLTAMGLITTALSLGVMVSMVFVGLMVDRIGPRMVLFWGTLLMAAFTAALLVVHSYASLLAVLFLVGMSLAVAPSAGTKAVFSAFAGRPRGLVMGIRQTGVPIGAALAAFLLPRLVPIFGLSPVFALFSVVIMMWSLDLITLPSENLGPALAIFSAALFLVDYVWHGIDSFGLAGLSLVAVGFVRRHLFKHRIPQAPDASH